MWLSIREFNLFIVNVIISKVGFTSANFLFSVYLLCFSIPALLPSLIDVLIPLLFLSLYTWGFSGFLFLFVLAQLL